mgnify:CR=1 FL=1
MAVKSNEIINSIKFLAFDMMDKAGEGNPGHTLTGVPIFYALYSNVLNVIPSNPSFINRDRLIIPSKNYSAALYATLFYAGYDYQIEDLKRYRDVDSYAPGALLYNKEMGIDASSSLAGDNTSLAVGISLSERYFESMFLNINKDLDLINYYTYVLLTNEDIQEGAGYEAMAFASNQKLNKLIFIYDNSGISSDGNISKTYTEDLETRLDALDFNIINVKNGNNPKQIEDALKDAKKSDMPSFVIVNNEFGYGLENSNSPRVYGSLISNEELIEIILKSGTRKYGLKEISHNILSSVNNISELKNIEINKLEKVEGMSKIKAIELVAAIELGRRVYEDYKYKELVELTSPKTIIEYFNTEYKNQKQELFYVVYLDNQKKYLAKKLLFKGTTNYSLVHPREIFKEAYLLSASYIICLHNHPSGNAMPSKNDIDITKQISQIGKIHGIFLLDHIIIGDNNYYSFYEDGKIVNL